MFYWQDYRQPILAALVVHVLVATVFLFQWQSSPSIKIDSPPNFIKAVNVQQKNRSATKKVAPPKPAKKVVKKTPAKPIPKPQKTIVKKPAPVTKPAQPVAPKERSFDELLNDEALPQKEQIAEPVESAQNDAQISDQADEQYASELDVYKNQIRQSIENVWVRPASAKRGMQATLRIVLLPGGEVLDVKVSKSSGNTAFDRSVEKAVWRAERLPVPNDNAFFNKYFRQFSLFFNPGDRL